MDVYSDINRLEDFENMGIKGLLKILVEKLLKNSIGRFDEKSHNYRRDGDVRSIAYP